MPSFLNKVFGHKKHDDSDQRRADTLLDGKYEAVQPPFPDPADLAFSFFKPKRKSLKSAFAPRLTLQLPVANDPAARPLAVFEADPDAHVLLDDAVVAAKRLGPQDALVLIRACALAISERGLETLGVMHPHWLSSSPDLQRKLISLFLRSTQPTTLPPSSSSTFEYELRYASPHDVAAVLRWALRHLVLENARFGKEPAEWAWYTTFFAAERDASYPFNAFSQLLLPQLPPSHLDLLTATLDLVSSLASHAETNSISGSKLSKFLGLWLLLAVRFQEFDDWSSFYARWERAGRVLEHVFLARLREVSFGTRLPTRLQELVKHYPYHSASPTADDGLLSRPRFSTRQHDALCVRVETLLAHDASRRPRQHPVQLLFEAFQLSVESTSEDEHTALWNALKAAVSEETEGPQFARIFVDETIQILSLIPPDGNAISPTLLASPITSAVSRKPSSSIAHDRGQPNADDLPVSTPPAVVTDWAQFSLSGFGDTPSPQPLVAPLVQDDDVEVTQPRVSRKSSRRRGKSRSRRRSSERAVDPLQLDPEQFVIETKLASVRKIQIDEAFVDFWSDAIVDPISADWPTFVVCALKQPQDAVRWLVVEKAYVRQQPETPRNASPDGRRGRSPRPSFKSDMSGFRINSVFSSARKRFSVFNRSATDLDYKRSGAKTPVTGELGQILFEEEPSSNADHPVAGNVAVAASGVTFDVADQLKIHPTPIDSLSSTDLSSAHQAPSVESSPRSGVGKHNGTELSPSSVERGSILGSVNLRVDGVADSVAVNIAVATDAQSSDALLPEEITDQRLRTEEEERPRQCAAAALTPSVDPPVSFGNEHPGEPHAAVVNETVETVATHAPSEDVAEQPFSSAVVAAVDDDPPEPAAEEPHGDVHSVSQAPDNVATSTVDRHEADNLFALSAPVDEVTDAESRTQLEPGRVASTDGDKEPMGISDLAEIPTSTTPGHVASVEGTVGQDGYGRPADISQVPADEPSLSPPAAAESGATLGGETSSATLAIEAQSVEIVADSDANADMPVAADSFRDGDVATGEAGSALAAAEALEVDVSAGIVPTRVRTELEPRVVEEGDVPTPTLERVDVTDETPGPMEEALPESEPCAVDLPKVSTTSVVDASADENTDAGAAEGAVLDEDATDIGATVVADEDVIDDDDDTVVFEPAREHAEDAEL